VPRTKSIEWYGFATTVAISLVALTASLLGIFVLEEWVGVRDASTLFLISVAAVAYLRGSLAAVVTALGAFLAYNFFFVPPRFTFAVADPQHVLSLLILLVVGVAIGRLTGLQRDHARLADLREREARAMQAVSRALAASKRTTDALPALVSGLAVDARLARVWIGLGATWRNELVVADTGADTAVPGIGLHNVLRREADGQGEWVRISPPGPPASPRQDGLTLYRIELVGGGEVIGSLCAQRDARLGPPEEEETRLLEAAADQIGQAIVRDRLAEQATELEVTRRSEELKSALLDSVSHDLRTPLAAIRATAGTLADPAVPMSGEKARAMALEIDSEADRLARLVADLLDMSRIEGGALKASVEPMPPAEIVHAAVDRARDRLAGHPIAIGALDDLPPVAVDPSAVDQVLANLLENAARHAAADARVAISGMVEEGFVRLRVEDSGPGVPADALPHLFEKFYRVPPRRERARQGTGLGLALVKGLVEAMNGRVSASIGDLGGLAIDLRLPIAAGAPP